MAAAVSSNDSPIIQAVNGRWEWNDTTNALEFKSNNPVPDKADRKKGKKPPEGIKNERGHTATNKRYMRSNLTQRQPSSKPGSRQGDVVNELVTLKLVKTVGVNMLAEVDSVSDNFRKFTKAVPFDDFLICILNYFHWLFEKIDAETIKNPLMIERSEAEKQRIETAKDKASTTLHWVGDSYSKLLLGIESHQYHHMAGGRGRVSHTHTDRSLYENLYSFCVLFVWIAFRRKSHQIIKEEIGRLLRSDSFTLGGKIKAIKDSRKREEKDKDKEEEQPESFKDGTWKKVTDEQKVLRKRPPIRRILTQKSPALSSLLPTPVEESSWLFGRLKERQEHQAKMTAQANRDETVTVKLVKRIGIIGDSLSKYNPVTLTPLDADQEAENNAEDSDAMSGENGPSIIGLKKTSLGLSRELTAVSIATTEALSEVADMDTD